MMTHLIYLHQGHAQKPSSLENLALLIAPLLNGESYIAKANPSVFSTMRGIEQAAERVVTEITDLIDSRTEINALSLVGVSLGGCILERAAERLMNRGMGTIVDMRFFITFASPLNGIHEGWNIPTVAAKLLAWLDTTLQDLVSMHGNPRDSVNGLSEFRSRICLANLKGDWRVPLSCALPLQSGNLPSVPSRINIIQTVTNGTASCSWTAIILDLSNRWDVHNAIVDDPRSLAALRDEVARGWSQT